jgi:hypothetical protein
MLASMETQTVTIQVDAATAVMLQERAKARGVSLDTLLRQLAEGLNGEQTERPFYETATAEEWIKELYAWGKSHDPNVPGLTLEDIVRESVYQD